MDIVHGIDKSRMSLMKGIEALLTLMFKSD